MDESIRRAISAQNAVGVEIAKMSSLKIPVPGFIQRLSNEAMDLIDGSNEHLTLLADNLLKSRVDLLRSLAKLSPFIDQSLAHWLDDYDGGLEDNTDLHAFCADTIFTTVPQPFHDALLAAENSMHKSVNTFEMLSKSETATMRDAGDVLSLAYVSRMEGQVCGIIAELNEKPVRLKREMKKTYDNTDAKVWEKLHKVIQDVITQYATIKSAKAVKLD